jgi:serralysin
LQVENLNLTGAAALDGFGNALDNHINGNGADNTISGFDGNDVLRGFDGNDFLFGGSGNDVLDGGIGADTMNGGSGNDTYHVDQVGDVVSEFGVADGTDTVVSTISTSLNVVGLAVENLTLVGGAVVGTGNGLNNTIVGDLLGNTLNGLAGNDRINGGAGGDLINGGIGNDTLNGQLGADVLNGGVDNDTLNGGLDNDIITTGSGNDTIVFNTPLGAGNVDSINDFSAANDTIKLDDAIFTGLPAGTLAADAFVVGPAAADAGDRIIYNDVNGNLFFDADGVGGADQVQFANLAPGLALTNSDFFVV